jgi:hypothetical protein
MYNNTFTLFSAFQRVFPWVCLLWFTACAPQPPTEPSSVDVSALQSIMDAQQKAWNEGQIEAFMQPYWKNDSLAFVGKSGVTRGWQATLDRYKKNYPSSTEMGRLQFENKEWKTIDLNHVYTLGAWTLFREADTLSGHYSLLWKRINGQWCIIADHSS